MADDKKKLYYSISEVADMTGLKPHILRFWEGEFPMLKPRKNRAGNRAYTERDIKIIGLIKQLLYDEKYTIDGAKKRMKSDKDFLNTQLSLPFKKEIVNLSDVRDDLLKLMEMVDSL
ncbi:MerR family transcriptional regulator [Candidatus Latescibacterota bacterium]